MPPFLPRKRLSSTPPPTSRPQPSKRAKLSDALDIAAAKPPPTLAAAKTFSLGSDNSDSSLSDVDSDEFEDVVNPGKSIAKESKVEEDDGDGEDNDDEQDEDVEWEDAGTKEGTESAPAHTPLAGGDIQITFRKDGEEAEYGLSAAANSSRKGPSKREKEARVTTHRIHVQFLLWHNVIRNRWICNEQIQKILVQQLPAQIKTQIEKWRRASGLSNPSQPSPSRSAKKKGKSKSKNTRGERDWNRNNQRLEVGKADLSRGDPLISLLKVLSAYWKKRFWITAPGLRKRGYETKQGLKRFITAYRTEEHDPEKYGEKIQNLQEFQELAKTCQGSRDLGAQLFTALLRGLGIEARLVASLQPAGYGWTKAEQPTATRAFKAVISSSSSESDSDDAVETLRKKSRKQTRSRGKPSGKRQKGEKAAPIDLDTDLDSDESELVDIKDDDSLVDITPPLPKARRQQYDRDVPFPIYWTEAISPITNRVYPVSPLIIQNPVATTVEILSTFEPRGQAAEKAKIVMAYVVAYSSDGTAKDVTTRYLKKQIWPGKTKGFRLPIEKVPVYNTRGKIKRYEDYDWFKHIMSPYNRTHAMRTAVDDVEDSTDLVRKEPEKKDDKNDVDTLQSLKSSADFVLERHLRREEALRPGSEPDRMFASGKGDNLKEEPVYKRSDVERCLTAESWHKEGRQPKLGETPMKLVPVRAVTLTRKREAEEYERQTGKKQMQGLYSWDQTEYIIPPPIENGIIPKNAYGNIDCFVPSMVPRGAVHIPLKSTVRICKKLEIDFAEAVTGFEFGNKRAVPVCTGVVVAKEHEKAVREAWRIFNEEQRKKEETKMEKLVLDLWRKFVIGLRIRERLAETYVDELDDTTSATTPFEASKQGTSNDPIDIDNSDGEAVQSGGFIPAADDDDMGGGFLLPHEDDISEQEDLIMENHEPEGSTTNQRPRWSIPHGISEDHVGYPTPVSVSPPKKASNRNTKRKSLLHESDDDKVADQDQNENEINQSDEMEDVESKDSKFSNSLTSKKKARTSNLQTPSPAISESDSESGTQSEDLSQGDSDSESDFAAATARSKSKSRPKAKATALSNPDSKRKTRIPTRSSTSRSKRTSIRNKSTSSDTDSDAKNESDTDNNTNMKAKSIPSKSTPQTKHTPKPKLTIDLGPPSQSTSKSKLNSKPRLKSESESKTRNNPPSKSTPSTTQTQPRSNQKSKTSPGKNTKRKRIVTSPYFDA